MDHFRVSLSLSKRVQVRYPSYQNDFDFHESEPAGRTRFRMNGFALRLVLKQRHKIVGYIVIPKTLQHTQMNQLQI